MYAGAFTGRLVDVFGLELYHPQIIPISKHPIGGAGKQRLTEPAIGPSWADLPFTLKVTPLGALDLTSRLAISKNSVSSIAHKQKFPRSTRPVMDLFTRADVVEVLVKELENRQSAW